MMNWGGRGMMDGTGFGIFSMFFGLIFMFLFLAGFVLLIVWIVRQFTPGGPSVPAQPARSNALAILEERFAKGEITKEEFAEMKKELQ